MQAILKGSVLQSAKLKGREDKELSTKPFDIGTDKLDLEFALLVFSLTSSSCPFPPFWNDDLYIFFCFIGAYS